MLYGDELRRAVFVVHRGGTVAFFVWSQSCGDRNRCVLCWQELSGSSWLDAVVTPSHLHLASTTLTCIARQEGARKYIGRCHESWDESHDAAKRHSAPPADLPPVLAPALFTSTVGINTFNRGPSCLCQTDSSASSPVLHHSPKHG